MPRADRPAGARWPQWAAVSVALAGALALVVVPGHQRLVATLVVLALGAIACWKRPDRLAWCWGFLLPIDFLTAVPSQVLDVARFGGLIWLCLELAPDLSAERRPIVVRLATLVGAVAVIRGVGSLARTDRFGMFIAAVMLLGALTAPFVAVRVRAHVSILAGFMAGVLLSAVVSVMQSFNLVTLKEGLPAIDRFPGLASTTMLITWHLAFGLIIACYFLAGRHHPPLHRLTALALVPIGLAALVVNGAQGGLLGLGLAVIAVGAFAWRQVSWRKVAPWLLAGVAAAAVVGGVMLAVGFATPTLDGLRGKDGYANEIARVTVNKQGAQELLAHPLFGMGRTNFAQEHRAENGSLLAPHFLPLEAGVTSGIVGFAVALYLLGTLAMVIVRGPVGRTPASWLGLALCAAMFGNALTETGGPFTGLPRFALLLIAVVACEGEPWAADGELPAATETVKEPTEAPAR